jgi:uncharacterized protein (DUF2141 family)
MASIANYSDFKITLVVFSVFIAGFFLSCKKESKIAPKATPIEQNLDSLETREYLIVKVSNIKELKGEMKIALYNNKSSFDKQENPFATAQIPVDKNVIEFKFENVPPSKDYALAVHHDANNNGKIDTNLLGIPKEGFCFSNNAMGNFGPPSYEDCKFEIKPGTFVIQDLKLIFF